MEETKKTPSIEEVLQQIDELKASNEKEVADLKSQLEGERKARQDAELKLATIKLSGGTKILPNQPPIEEPVVFDFDY